MPPVRPEGRVRSAVSKDERLRGDTFEELAPLPVPVLNGVAPESALRELMPPADDEAQDHVGAHRGVGILHELVLRDAESHRLLERGLEPVM